MLKKILGSKVNFWGITLLLSYISVRFDHRNIQIKENILESNLEFAIIKREKFSNQIRDRHKYLICKVT